MIRYLCLVAALAAISVADVATANGADSAKRRLTAHLTVRNQPGHPRATTIGTRADISFTLTGRLLAWDGVFNQLSSWPFTVRVIFPDKSAPAIALCKHPWPPSGICRAPQGEVLDAGATPVSGEVLGNLTISKAQRRRVLAGSGYVVLATATNPRGEIRGKLKASHA